MTLAWPLAKMALRLLLIAALLYALHLVFGRLAAMVAETLHPGARTGLIVALLVLYALLMALPFVPGIEIGLALLVVIGAPVAPFVWMATTTGLLLSYAIGLRVSPARIDRLLALLRAERARALVARIAPLDPAERLALLADHLPPRLRPLAGGPRYLFLGLLLNLPGNALLGGGGGIALVAGLSRLFRPLPMALTVAVAVSPVALAVWLFGSGVL